MNERFLTDEHGNTLRCASCRQPAVRTYPGADGQEIPVCFTEEEGARAVEQYFSLAARVYLSDRYPGFPESR